jgi:hypothetical protein
MSTLKPTVYRFDRRQFLTYSSLVGVGAFVNVDRLAAQDKCELLGPEQISDNYPAKESTDLNCYIDGLHFNDNLSNIESRANLAFFMNVQQSPDKFVERVVLTDENNQALGSRFFDASDRLSTGQPPYVIFNNIRMVNENKYYVYYQVREGSTVTLFRFVLQNARRSQLNFKYLPNTMVTAFEPYQGANPGFLTSPFQFYTLNRTDVHTAKGHIKEIESDNSFKISIEGMHSDLNSGHYMRYFIVTDPVGRLLGYKERTYEEDSLGKPKNIYEDSPKVAGSPGVMTVEAMPDAQRVKDNLYPYQIAKINDCPYVQIFTEDVYDALARSVIYLV